MDFVIQWFCYLLAFVAGSAVAYPIRNRLRRPIHDQQTPADAADPLDVGPRR